MSDNPYQSPEIDANRSGLRIKRWQLGLLAGAMYGAAFAALGGMILSGIAGLFEIDGLSPGLAGWETILMMSVAAACVGTVCGTIVGLIVTGGLLLVTQLVPFSSRRSFQLLAAQLGAVCGAALGVTGGSLFTSSAAFWAIVATLGGCLGAFAGYRWSKVVC